MDVRVITLFVITLVVVLPGKNAHNGQCSLELCGGCDCKVYEFHCQQPSDEFRDAAKVECESNGGTLALLKTPKMNQAVFNFIAAQNLSENECIQQFGFWIGLGDKDKEGQYVWDDGTSLCSTLFTDWAKKEPNNNEKKDVNGQDCVQLWYRQRTKDMWGKWDDEYCAFREKGFICEYTIPYCDYTTYFGGIQPNPCPQTTVTLP